MNVQLHCYVVCMQFACGVGGVHFALAINEQAAAAEGVDLAHRTEPKPTGILSNIMVKEVSAGQLRSMLQAVETGQPSTERVIRLASDNPRVPETTPEACRSIWPPDGAAS